MSGATRARPGPFSRLHAILGAPGLMIAVVSVLSFVFGLVVLTRGYHQFRDTTREALRDVFGEWVRSTPVDYLRNSLKDYADRWRRAAPAERTAMRPTLRDRLEELGDALRQPGTQQDPLLSIVEMDLIARDGTMLARWPSPPPAGPRGVGPADRRESLATVPVLDAGPDSARLPAVDLIVRYRVAPVVAAAGADLEASYHRLLLALLGLSGYSLLCLGYMVLHVRSLRERVAREAAQEATLDLADRTCHELGNVVFVLANERRNLDNHLDLVARFAAEEPEALRDAARRAGLDAAQANRLDNALRREYADRGIDPAMELVDSIALTRDVCRQVEICSEFIAMTVRELDGYLKQSTLPVSPEPVGVGACVSDALALLGPRLGAAGASVEGPSEAAARLSVRADRRLLVHVLVNLLKNGVEAASASGGAPRIVLDAHAEGPTVWISVADNGPGIPLADQPRVFDFGYSTKGAGRGRGLAIVRESIAAQKGRIRFSSRPGEGTEFLIGLPSAP